MPNFPSLCRSLLCRELLFQNPSVGGDGNDLPGGEFAACQQGSLDGVFDAGAAGNLHANDRYALNVVFCDDAGQLFGVVALVQFRTADQCDAVADKLVMEVAVSVGSAVGGDEQIGTVKVRGVNGDELDLAGPLRKLTRHTLGLARRGGCTSPDAFGLRSGTAAGEIPPRSFQFRLAHCILVVGGRLAFLEGDCPRRTSGQAIAKAIAIILAGEYCLAVDHLNRALMAGLIY